MRHFNRGVGAAVLAFSLAATTVACGSTEDGDAPGMRAVEADGVRIAADADGSGVEATRLLVESAPVVVVAAPDEAAQATAASVAVGLRAPMLTAVPGGEAGLADEVSRLEGAGKGYRHASTLPPASDKVRFLPPELQEARTYSLHRRGTENDRNWERRPPDET